MANLSLQRAVPTGGKGKRRKLRRRLERLLLSSWQHRSRKGRPQRPPRVHLVVQSSALKRWGRELTENVWSRRGLRRRISQRAPSLDFKGDSWAPEARNLIGMLAEPYAPDAEERACDFQFWRHWASVEENRSSLLPQAYVWPRRFRIRCALVTCAPLWYRRCRLHGLAVGGVNVSQMDRLASPSFFPWAVDDAVFQRSRFPCELWMQEHHVHHTAAGEDGVLCAVDVMDPLRSCSHDAASLPISKDAHEAGIHALVTWTEVEDPDVRGWGWWSTATFEEVGASRVVAPGPYKQGLLLARRPWHSSELGWDAGSETSKRQRQSAQNSRPPAFVKVQAHFDPAKGELWIDARWDDGQAF